MIWRCTACLGQHHGSVARTLDPRYGSGYCLPCRQQRIMQVHDEPATGEALRDAGMARAASNASNGVDGAWQAAARQVARLLAESGREFTQDDITDEVGLPSSRNATGSLLAGLARKGIIVRVGDRKGKRDSQHARRISVWRGTESWL